MVVPVDDGKVVPIVQSPFKTIFPLDIPEALDWIIEGILLRSSFHTITAPGGTGKSTLSICIGLALATGTSWGPFVINRPYKVLFVSKEDPLNVTIMRVTAAVKEMGLQDKQSLLQTNFLLHENPDSVIMATLKDGLILPHIDVIPLTADIKRLGADVLILDPQIELFPSIDENSNSQMSPAMSIIRKLCRDCNIAAIPINHTAKGKIGKDSGNPDAGRGAGAVKDKSRGGMTFMRVDPSRATGLKIPADIINSMRELKVSKANYAGDDEFGWLFQFVSVPIEVRGGTGSQFIGVLKPYELDGDIIEDLPPSVVKIIVDKIRLGRIDPTDDKGKKIIPYKSVSRFPGWAGELFLLPEFGLKKVNGRQYDTKTIEKILVELVAKDLIRKGPEQYHDSKGNKFYGYETEAEFDKRLI